MLPSIETHLPADLLQVQKDRTNGTSMRMLAEWNRALSPGSLPSGPDALVYLHEAAGKLALLALEIAGHSPIRARAR